MKQKLRIPVGISTPEQEHDVVEFEINSEPCGAEIVTIDGVNERGKTAILNDVVDATSLTAVKEPPKFVIPGYTETTWYDVLVKGHVPEFRERIFYENQGLIREILLNAGVINSVDEETSFLGEEFIVFWAFVFSRLAMKEDIQHLVGEKTEKRLLSDRNVMTSLAMNLGEYINERDFDESVFLGALKVYSYLGRNNYIPTSKDTFVITSEKNQMFSSGRGVGADINDSDRQMQEIVYRRIIEAREKGEYRRLMQDFVGNVWHVEMSHIEPMNGWVESIDSKILSLVMLELIKRGKLPDYIDFPLDAAVRSNILETSILTGTSEPLHVTGDFSIVWGDSELFIRTFPSFLEPESTKMLSHVYWHVAPLNSFEFESPMQTRQWFEAVLRSIGGLTVPSETLYAGNETKAKSLGLETSKNVQASGEWHFFRDWGDGYWGAALEAFRGRYKQVELFEITLAALEHASEKQGLVTDPSLANDIFPGVMVKWRNGVSESTVVRDNHLNPDFFAINPDRRSLYALDTKIKVWWPEVLAFIEEYTKGIDSIFIGNATIFNGSRYPFSAGRWALRGGHETGKDICAINLALELGVDRVGSQNILTHMREINDRHEWDLPFGYDLGDLVKVKGVMPLSLLVHSFDLRDKRTPRNTFTKIDLGNLFLRNHLIESGFFRDFGHGPLQALINKNGV